VLLIVFSTLGVVYFFGRLVFPKKIGKSDSKKNLIAALFSIIFGFLFTLVFDYSSMIEFGFDRVLIAEYLTWSIIHTSIAIVFYVAVGWRFYSRFDAYLDKKFAKDDRRKQ